MKPRTAIGIISGTIMLLSAEAPAQTVKKAASGLSGTVTSKSVAIVDTGGGDQFADVYTTPAVGLGFFVLTQACVTDPGNVQISGATLGRLVLSTNDECTQFDPGVAFAASETVTCTETNDNGDQVCTITGVVTK